MSLLTRYVLRRFLFLALFTGLASLMIFVTVDLMENLDKFIDSQTPAGEIVQYYLLYVPQIVYLISPVILLLTTVFTLGGLVRTSEVTAMKASGVSPARLLRLLGFWAAVFSVGVFVLGETVVTTTARERMEIYRTRIRKQPATLQTNSGRIYFQNDSTSMFTLENYSFEEEKGRRAAFLRFDDGRLQERIDAQIVVRDSTGWRLVDGVVRTLLPTLAARSFAERPLPELRLDPLDIQSLQAAPEEMNLRELETFIARQRQSGARVSRWEVNARAKVANPLANFVIVLFGVPIAMRRNRAGAMLGFGLSLLCAFGYYGIQVVCQNLGYKELLDPLVAAWIPNLLFGLLTIPLYFQLDR